MMKTKKIVFLGILLSIMTTGWAVINYNLDIKNHIIGIDDSNLLGTIQEDSLGNVICDYSNITLKLVKEKILKINPSYDIGIYSPYNMEMLIAFIK